MCENAHFSFADQLTGAQRRDQRVLFRWINLLALLKLCRTSNYVILAEYFQGGGISNKIPQKYFGGIRSHDP
jgi:hypothetical protein